MQGKLEDREIVYIISEGKTKIDQKLQSDTIDQQLEQYEEEDELVKFQSTARIIKASAQQYKSLGIKK